jgi:NAD-dependent dihydropyrimidine dehydrogenase PreA subunit
MADIKNHPTVVALRSRQGAAPRRTSAASLRAMALEAGAHDVGFVSLSRPELDDRRADILKAFPPAKTLLSFVCRMSREPIRSVARSVSNLEFHRTGDQVNEVSGEIVCRLEAQGIRALNASAGFPMEMSQFPGKVWMVSHKPVAVAAGLGRMGIHRNVIHPKFGNFILLGTVLIDAEIEEESTPIDYNPCLECKLCVAACPVGAIKPDGQFDPSACLTHNYREFMNGFTDWVEQVADSRDALDYRSKVTDVETVSMWQSLSFGANYKAAYCLAVCPAGEDVIGPFLNDRPTFLKEIVKPLQDKEETVYVVPQSDAEDFVRKRFPHKTAKQVAGVRPTSVAGFVSGMKIIFQSGKAKGVNATYHFSFFGKETLDVTVTIKDQMLAVTPGLVGAADCSVRADSATWLGFIRKEKSIVWAVITGKVKISGRRRLMGEFARCFPS